MSPDASCSSHTDTDSESSERPVAQWLSVPETPSARRARTVTATVLLMLATVVAAVALSQWFVGAGQDPRDSLGSRAAGFGFGDEARSTLFSVLPLALPFLAVLLAPRPPFRQFAVVYYFVVIGIGASLAFTAAVYGWDQSLQESAFGSVWLHEHDVLQRAALDGAWLIAFVLALLWTRRVGVKVAAAKDLAVLTHMVHNQKFWTKLLPAMLTVRYRLISKRYELAIRKRLFLLHHQNQKTGYCA